MASSASKLIHPCKLSKVKLSFLKKENKGSKCKTDTMQKDINRIFHDCKFICKFCRDNYFYFQFPVAVFICFLIFWTPHHIQRIMSLIVTKLGSWTIKLKETQEILHLIAGKFN